VRIIEANHLTPLCCYLMSAGTADVSLASVTNRNSLCLVLPLELQVSCRTARVLSVLMHHETDANNCRCH
jgi:hypothetical protein